MKTGTVVVSPLVCMIIVCLSMFGGMKIAHADSYDIYIPPCASPYNPEYQKTSAVACGVFVETFYFDNLDKLKDTAYVYLRGEFEGGASSIELSTSTPVVLYLDLGGPSHYSYFAFSKNKLQGATGSSNPMSISTTTVTQGSIDGPDFNTIHQELLTTPGVQGGVMNFVVPNGDDSLGLSALSHQSSISKITDIDGKFVQLSDPSLDPSIKVSVTNPVKKRDLFYSPLGIYKDVNIVLYKSKQIDTLDDGSIKTTVFPPPSIDGVVPLMGISNTLALTPSPSPATQPWYLALWCFIAGLFGNAC